MSTCTSIYVLINVHASIYVHHVFLFVSIYTCMSNNDIDGHAVI